MWLGLSEMEEGSKMRSKAKMRKRCKILCSSFVNFCESPNFQNQEIDIVIVVVVGVRRVAKKSHIDVRRVRRISESRGGHFQSS